MHFAPSVLQFTLSTLWYCCPELCPTTSFVREPPVHFLHGRCEKTREYSVSVSTAILKAFERFWDRICIEKLSWSQADWLSSADQAMPHRDQRTPNDVQGCLLETREIMTIVPIGQCRMHLPIWCQEREDEWGWISWYPEHGPSGIHIHWLAIDSQDQRNRYIPELPIRCGLFLWHDCCRYILFVSMPWNAFNALGFLGIFIIRYVLVSWLTRLLVELFLWDAPRHKIICMFQNHVRFPKLRPMGHELALPTCLSPQSPFVCGNETDFRRRLLIWWLRSMC